MTVADVAEERWAEPRLFPVPLGIGELGQRHAPYAKLLVPAALAERIIRPHVDRYSDLRSAAAHEERPAPAPVEWQWEGEDASGVANRRGDYLSVLFHTSRC